MVAGDPGPDDGAVDVGVVDSGGVDGEVVPPIGMDVCVGAVVVLVSFGFTPASEPNKYERIGMVAGLMAEIRETA